MLSKQVPHAGLHKQNLQLYPLTLGLADNNNPDGYRYILSVSVKTVIAIMIAVIDKNTVSDSGVIAFQLQISSSTYGRGHRNLCGTSTAP